MKKSFILLACTCLIMRSAEVFSQQAILFENDTFRIEKMDNGYKGPGINFFTVSVRNKTAGTQDIGIDLVADPRFGLIRSQRQFYYRLSPNETRLLEAVYTIPVMTSQALLRVRIGVPAAGLRDIEIQKYFLTDTLPVKADPELCYDLTDFVMRPTDHFIIWGSKGSLSEKEMDRIARERENGFIKVSHVLGVKPEDKINLIFYPDGETKTRATGHTGAGLARGNCIIEIYNEETKLDPYHETAHIILAELGNPPAMFNEGFAVYISEVLGSNSMGSPGLDSDQVTKANLEKNALVPLSELFAFPEIGSVRSNYSVSYPEAASFVRFIIGKYGQEKFHTIVSSLQNSNSQAIIEANRKKFEESLGITLQEVEKLWLSSLQQ